MTENKHPLIRFFEQEIEAGIRHQQTKHLGGQKVPPSSDFAYCPISALIKLQWWAREFENALNKKEDGSSQ